MNLRSWTADRRVVVAAIALVWLISRGAILSSIDPDETDVELYFRYAVRGVDEDQVPYRDFDIEYPPVAYWFVALPRILDRSPLPADTFERPLSKSPAFYRYGHLYEAQAVLCDLLALVLLLDIVRRRWPEHFASLGAGYLGVTTLLWPVLFVRLDIGLTALLMAWAWFWVKAEDDSPSAGRNRLLSYTALGLSISFKLVPIIVAPFLLLAELRSPRPRARVGQALVALVASVALPFAVHLPSAGAGLLRLFSYHAERGIQVESLYASLLGLATGWQLDCEHSFGSWNVATEWTPLIKSCSAGLLVTFLAALGLWSWRQGRRFSSERALAAACLALCGSVILTKVLSPQYFVWALPVALLLSAQVLPQKWTYTWLAAAGLIAVARITTWVFPYHYGELLEMGHGPWLVVAARNLLYLGLIAGLGARLWLSARQRPMPKSLPLAAAAEPHLPPAARRASRRSVSAV